MKPWDSKHKTVLLVLGLTVAVWLTSFAHKVPDSATAVGAVILLYALGLLETDDVSKISWATLLLFGGGLSLGTAIDSSGLGRYTPEELIGKSALDFIVPVGTPPSAIAYSSGHISVTDMIRAGIWVTLTGVILIVLLALFNW